eukprot:m.378968 g.378968  ORF g.378968 m.378968 type:complete len:53 (+) comp20943_c0_seq2:1424-1582(+)
MIKKCVLFKVQRGEPLWMSQNDPAAVMIKNRVSQKNLPLLHEVLETLMWEEK